MAIDFVYNKDRPLVKTNWLDLSTKIGQSEFWQLYDREEPALVFMAPPCGTASRARDIRLWGSKRGSMRRLGLKGKGRGERQYDPPPLRSDACPDGLPDISPEHKIRVLQANVLYDFCTQVARATKMGYIGIFIIVANSTVGNSKINQQLSSG